MHLVLLAAVFLHVNVARLHHHTHQLIAPTEPVGGQLQKSVAAESALSAKYNPYTKHRPGRHVCAVQRNVTIPIKTKEPYCKPVYKKYIERCHNNQLCTGVKLVYEASHKDVIVTRTTNYITYTCCPGWSQGNNRSHGCNKPQCSIKCQNGGSCMKPSLCICLKGYAGRNCEKDIDECKEQKPCDQICHNTFGSYRCECREKFFLHSDGQSCKRKDGDGVAFEAKDLEYELLDKRLYTLEMILSTKQANIGLGFTDKGSNFTNNINSIFKDISYLKTKLKEWEEYRTELSILKYKIERLEKKTATVDEVETNSNKTKMCVLTNKLCF